MSEYAENHVLGFLTRITLEYSGGLLAHSLNECRKKGHRKKGHRKNGHGKKGTGKMGTGKKGTSEKLGKKGTLQKKTDIM